MANSTSDDSNEELLNLAGELEAFLRAPKEGVPADTLGRVVGAAVQAYERDFAPAESRPEVPSEKHPPRALVRRSIRVGFAVAAAASLLVGVGFGWLLHETTAYRSLALEQRRLLTALEAAHPNNRPASPILLRDGFVTDSRWFACPGSPSADYTALLALCGELDRKIEDLSKQQELLSTREEIIVYWNGHGREIELSALGSLAAASQLLGQVAGATSEPVTLQSVLRNPGARAPLSPIRPPPPWPRKLHPPVEDGMATTLQLPSSMPGFSRSPRSLARFPQMFGN